ncbi:hypothetical protein BKA81DRAFT_22813 [Phyllosticta paracitricarpa]
MHATSQIHPSALFPFLQSSLDPFDACGMFAFCLDDGQLSSQKFLAFHVRSFCAAFPNPKWCKRGKRRVLLSAPSPSLNTRYMHTNGITEMPLSIHAVVHTFRRSFRHFVNPINNLFVPRFCIPTIELCPLTLGATKFGCMRHNRLQVFPLLYPGQLLAPQCMLGPVFRLFK